MDYINTTTFEVRRDRNIKDKTGWVPSRWRDEEGVLKTITLPDSDKKYWKYSNSKVMKMTTTQKKSKDDKAELSIFNNRSKSQIFSSIRLSFEESGDKELIFTLLDKYGSFRDCVEERDFNAARYVIDKIPESVCSTSNKNIIKDNLPL